jgi:hypothetical protein
MTYEELLAKINKWEYDDYKAMGTTSEWPYKIIRAVVELHKPVMGDCCEACYREEYFGGRHLEVGKYPCETIQAIEKELG